MNNVFHFKKTCYPIYKGMRQSMENTQTIGIGWCVVQLPLTLLFLLNHNEPDLIIYSVHNKTVTETHVGSSPMYLAVSFAVMIFGMITMQMKKAQILDNMNEFNSSMMESFAVWNSIFWVTFFSFHVLLISQRASPVDPYFVGFVVAGQFMTIHYMCKPRELYRGYENISFLMYVIFAAIVYYEIHEHHEIVFLALAVCLDLLLITGHTYDEQTNIEVVGNCRLFYVCSVCVVNLGLYIMA